MRITFDQTRRHEQEPLHEQLQRSLRLERLKSASHEAREQLRARPANRARMEAALELGSRGVWQGGRIINACEAIHASYQSGELPKASHVATLRDAVRELQALLNAYGMSGLIPKTSDASLKLAPAIPSEEDGDPISLTHGA